MQLVRREARMEVKKMNPKIDPDEVNYVKDLPNDYIDSTKRSYFNRSTANHAVHSLPTIDKMENGSQHNLASRTSKNDPFLNANGVGRSSNENDKAYADIRIKIGGQRKSPGKILQKGHPMKVGGTGGVRDDDLDSIPSQISDDMWGELPKYQYKLHLDQLKKAKEDVKRKKQLVKSTLDGQLKEQQDKKLRDRAEAKEVEKGIIAKAKNELEEEKKKQEKLRQKTIEAKDQRDQMLKEAMAKKEHQFKQDRKKELDEVQKLQEALDKEKKDKIEKKKAQRAQAQLVIQENEREKARREAEKEEDRKKNQKMIEDYNKAQEAVEKKRAQEIADKEARIQKIMGSMGENLKNNDAEKQRAEDRRFLQAVTQKEKEAVEKEKKKREDAFQRDLEVRKMLAIQMEEKRKIHADEQDENKKYVQMVIDIDNKHKQEQADKIKKQQEKMREVQRFQRIQMGGIHDDQVEDVTSRAASRSMPP